ncbi:hypothetical protein ACTHQ6_09845 [Arthrobacter sp. SAFR-179]|uniref:hypothetical protein n=1 Tax=Arthrobacter sp. SAFR-179 TaxID=3387279 RepID=UPI003F7BCB58
MVGSNATAAAESSATPITTVAAAYILKEAATHCGVPHDADAKLGDNDTSLTLNGKGKEDLLTGLPDSMFDCILKAAKTPDYVRSQMGSTRALDGTQHASWDKISASWTYHPNTGLDVVLNEAK